MNYKRDKFVNLRKANLNGKRFLPRSGQNRLKKGWLAYYSYPLSVGTIGYEVDLGAEKLIAAEREQEKIAVEIKGFTGPSDVNEFHKAVGQFNDYFVALEIA